MRNAALVLGIIAGLFGMIVGFFGWGYTEVIQHRLLCAFASDVGACHRL